MPESSRPTSSTARSVTARRSGVNSASRYGAERDARDAELARLVLAEPHDGVVRDVDPTLFAGAWVAANWPIAWVVDARRWRVEALVTERDALRLARWRGACPPER